MFKVIYDPVYGQVVPDADMDQFVKCYLDEHSRNAKVIVGNKHLFFKFYRQCKVRNIQGEFYYDEKLMPDYLFGFIE